MLSIFFKLQFQSWQRKAKPYGWEWFKLRLFYDSELLQKKYSLKQKVAEI